MSKFHLSEDGTPRPCSAEPGKCPIDPNAPHFETKVAAIAAYEAQQAASTIAAPIKRDSQAREFEYEVVRPESVYEYVPAVKNAGDVQNGSILITTKGAHRVVHAKRGYKNVEFELDNEDGTTRKVVYKLEDQVNVNEKQETAESQVESNSYYIEAELERRLKSYKPQRARAVAMMTQAIQKGRTLDSFQMRTLIEAEANDRVMAEFEDTVASVKENAKKEGSKYYGVKNLYTAAYEHLKKEYSDDAIRHASRGESHSTSAVSNAYEAELLKAKARFLDLY